MTVTARTPAAKAERTAAGKPPLPRALSRRVGFLLAKAHNAVHESADAALAPLGLNVKQYAVLSVLDDEGPDSQQSLGERMRVDRTTMVAVVDALEADGRAQRRRNPEDRRAYSLEVTAAGRRVLKRANQVLGEHEREFFAPLSGAEEAELKRLLAALLEPR